MTQREREIIYMPKILVRCIWKMLGRHVETWRNKTVPLCPWVGAGAQFCSIWFHLVPDSWGWARSWCLLLEAQPWKKPVQPHDLDLVENPQVLAQKVNIWTLQRRFVSNSVRDVASCSETMGKFGCQKSCSWSYSQFSTSVSIIFIIILKQIWPLPVLRLWRPERNHAAGPMPLLGMRWSGGPDWTRSPTSSHVKQPKKTDENWWKLDISGSDSHVVVICLLIY